MTSHPSWLGTARTPEAAECSIALILERRAAEAPDAPFAAFPEAAWTNAEALALARQTAAAFQALGIAPGDRVANWLPNSAGHLRVMLGAAILGAVSVPMNTALRGGPLADALRVCGARLVVAHAALAPLLDEVPAEIRPIVVTLGQKDDASSGTTDGPALRADPAALSFTPRPEAWDLGFILFTSGTTGGVKAVRVPNGQLWAVGQAHFGFLRRYDRLMLTTPLCHIGPLSAFMGALMSGASVVVPERFRTSTFWRDIRQQGITAVPGMGPSLLHFLNSAPPRPDDRDNGLRIVNVVAADAAARAFAARFGVSFFPSFGMTELSVPIVGDVDSLIEGSCGRVRDGMEVRIVDAHDIEVPDGTAGEIVVRPRHPWVVNDGYDGNPEATVQAWRNGWFHTGDTARRDPEGNFFFVDRNKDVIRRRGENISSIEVERAVKEFAAVGDCAAVAVPSEHGDQEVLVVLSPADGKTVDPAELLRFVLTRLPHFMVPRFIRIMDELPRTPSNKVRKAELRQDGLTSDVWDREKAGVVVRAPTLGRVD